MQKYFKDFNAVALGFEPEYKLYDAKNDTLYTVDVKNKGQADPVVKKIVHPSQELKSQAQDARMVYGDLRMSSVEKLSAMTSVYGQGYKFLRDRDFDDGLSGVGKGNLGTTSGLQQKFDELKDAFGTTNRGDTIAQRVSLENGDLGKRLQSASNALNEVDANSLQADLGVLKGLEKAGYNPAMSAPRPAVHAAPGVNP